MYSIRYLAKFTIISVLIRLWMFNLVTYIQLSDIKNSYSQTAYGCEVNDIMYIGQCAFHSSHK